MNTHTRGWRTPRATEMRTLRARLIASHVLPILIVVPLIGLAAFLLFRLQLSLAAAEAGVQTELARTQDRAQELADAAGRLDQLLNDPAAARDFLSSVTLDVHNVTLLDKAGHVVASTDSGTQLAPSISDQDVNSVLRGQGAVQIQMTGESGRQLAEIAIPILGDQRQVEGIVLVQQQLGSVQSQLGNLSAILVAIVIVLFAVGILLGLLLALRLSRSLGQVTGTIDDIAHGQQPAELPAHDVAEFDALYQSVNGLAERLKTLEDARKRLLANLVHELGRPLGSIRAAAFALRNGAVDDPALRDELLGGINAQIERMQPLLDNLTQLHGQVLGNLELNRSDTPLGPWLSQVLALWREAAREKGITWKADIPMSLPTVSIDADPMSRAVGNLLSNAVKFTPAGGTIKVEASERQGDLPGEPSTIAIVVEDSGPGIAAGDQARIFEPFQRGQQGTRFAQGVGLGLSIATDIAQAHGGGISVESAPGQGSRFTLTFPASA